MQNREQNRHSWLQQELSGRRFKVDLVSGDASFRSYFRVSQPQQPDLILMDAPPEHENNQAYIHVAQMLKAVNVAVPELYAQDLKQGFLLISDLGDEQYADHLNPETAEHLYADAMDVLFRIQTHDFPDITDLPAYDRPLLERELGIFTEWFLGAYLGLEASTIQIPAVRQCFEVLVNNALAQDRVFVHRDYHSRNLMLLENNNPGVLDFQDAVYGPVTYDLVSLLRDCYISWPQEQVETWVQAYWQRLRESSVVSVEWEQFKTWFDLMGMQRHLKAIGIFCRLNLRDGKPGYIADIPRVLNYVFDVVDRYEQLHPFGEFMRRDVVPLFPDELKS